MEADEPQTDCPTAMKDLVRGLKAALQQWDRAFSFMTKLRKEAVVSQIDQKFDYLLKEAEALPVNKEAR